MRTTVDIPDPVFEEAKKLALREGTSLRELVAVGLRMVLNERRVQGVILLRDARVGGQGLQPDLHDAGWEGLRRAAYHGQGG
jgi:hypothetical protein